MSRAVKFYLYQTHIIIKMDTSIRQCNLKRKQQPFEFNYIYKYVSMYVKYGCARTGRIECNPIEMSGRRKYAIDFLLSTTISNLSNISLLQHYLYNNNFHSTFQECAVWRGREEEREGRGEIRLRWIRSKVHSSGLIAPGEEEHQERKSIKRGRVE